MRRSVSVMLLLCATTGCAVGPAGPEATAVERSSPAAFTGEWRSVTPSLEFIRLSLASKSSEMGVVAARLTFSGVYWEGAGRSEGDSLVAGMTIVGAASPSGVFVAHARDARTLEMTFRPRAAPPLEVTFVREE
jgi:hypothetical protein